MEKTQEIKNWKELIAFVKEIDPYRNTIVLTGFINKIKSGGALELDKLIFTSKSIYEDKEVKKDD